MVTKKEQMHRNGNMDNTVVTAPLLIHKLSLHDGNDPSIH